MTVSSSEEDRTRRRLVSLFNSSFSGVTVWRPSEKLSIPSLVTDGIIYLPVLLTRLALGLGSFEIIFTITVAILSARYMYGILIHLSLKSSKTKKVNLPLLALSSDADSKNGKTGSSTSWEPIPGDLTNS